MLTLTLSLSLFFRALRPAFLCNDNVYFAKKARPILVPRYFGH